MAPKRPSATHPGPDPLCWPDELLSDGRTAPATRPIGRVNTPANIARWMVNESLASIREDSSGLASEDGNVCREGESNLTIVEPAAGSGVILGALAEALSRAGKEAPEATSLAGVWAIDSDMHAREMAGRRLLACVGEGPVLRLQGQYRIGDALLEPALMPAAPVDLIIGNPPYLGLRHARRLAAFPAWCERFGTSEDLYVYFIRWATDVVRPGGCVALLVPDGWLTLSSYEGLRTELLQGCFELIALLPGNTFSKRVNPCFFVWRKHTPAGACRFVDLRKGALADAGLVADLARKRETLIEQSVFQKTPHRRLVPPPGGGSHLASLDSLARGSSPDVVLLEEVARMTDAGIHSRNCRHRLFFSDRVKPDLQRLLQGRQIDQYAVRWDTPNAQFRWVDIHYKPKPSTLGRRRNGTPSVRNEYWDWQGSPELHALPERILIRQTGDSIVAARCVQDKDVYYTDNTLFTAIVTDKAAMKGITCLYLVAYLNSAIVTRLYQSMSCERGRPQAQIKISLLRELPFAWPMEEERLRIEAAARELEAAARTHSPSTARSQTRGAKSRAVPNEAPAHPARKIIDEHFDALLSKTAQATLVS